MRNRITWQDQMVQDIGSGLQAGINRGFEETERQKALAARKQEQETERQRALNRDAFEQQLRLRAMNYNTDLNTIKQAMTGELADIQQAEAAPGFEGPPRPGLFDRRTDEYEQGQARQNEMYDLSKRQKESQISANYAKARQEKQGQSLKGIDDLRKEVNALPATKDTVAIGSALGKIRDVDESPAGDISLIFNYMKINDPGSVVREGEFATAQNAAGVPDQVRNMYNQMLSGKRLNPNQRKDFRTQAYHMANAQLESFRSATQPIRVSAEQRGLPQDQIFPQFNFARPEQVQPQGVAQNAPLPAGAQVATIPGSPQIPNATDPFQQAMDAAVSPAMAAPQVLSPEVLQQKMSRYQELKLKQSGGR